MLAIWAAFEKIQYSLALKQARELKYSDATACLYQIAVTLSLHNPKKLEASAQKMQISYPNPTKTFRWQHELKLDHTQVQGIENWYLK